MLLDNEEPHLYLESRFIIVGEAVPAPPYRSKHTLKGPQKVGALSTQTVSALISSVNDVILDPFYI